MLSDKGVGSSRGTDEHELQGMTVDNGNKSGFCRVKIDSIVRLIPSIWLESIEANLNIEYRILNIEYRI